MWRAAGVGCHSGKVGCVMATQSWAWNLHRRIGGAVREARRLRHVTAQQVADKTVEMGYPISRDVIANYECGRKQSLDVTELLVLAKVLDVPPLALLFPGQAATQVEVLPGVTATTLDAVLWFGADKNQHGPRVEMQAAITQLETLIGTAATAMGGQGTLSGVPQSQS